jgi:hypothetical protein
LWLAAPLVFLAASVAIARRQPLAHTRLLAVAAAAWAMGDALFALGAREPAIAWWFAFLVLTIAAERLEMTRLMPRRAAAMPLVLAAAAVLLAGAAIATFHDRAGGIVFGAALCALAAWLGAFDVARRTVRADGLARYSAVALIAGYLWLFAAGVAWALAHAGAAPSRDLALHALGLGFVFSMILAHAPVVVPAVARVRFRFTGLFYVPLFLLHASLLLRVVPGFEDFAARRAGGVLNAAALAIFIATVLRSVRP